MKRLRPSNAAFSGSIMVPMTGVELSAAAEPSREAETAWRKPMRSLLGHIADLLLPPVCISCRARIGSHGLLCGACFAKIDFIAPPICARLGIPVPYDAGEPLLSAAAIAKPPVYDRARAAARYSATMRELIQSFKYRDRHEGLPLFGLWLKKAGAELLAEADLIVPVPLYRSRLWWRRFNQSAMLAHSVRMIKKRLARSRLNAQLPCLSYSSFERQPKDVPHSPLHHPVLRLLPGSKESAARQRPLL
jgi:predicted amidophosphoribosyltransferase